MKSTSEAYSEKNKKMIGLETQVREALIEQRADELVKTVSEYPEYKSKVMELIETLAESMTNSMATTFGNVDEDEKQKIMQECRQEILPQIKSQFDNPEQLRQAFYEQVRQQYLSSKQLEENLNSHFVKMRDKGLGIGDEIVDKYQESYKRLFEFVKINDKIVERLVEIAKTEGLEKVTQKETRYSVIKEFFPTAEEYRNHVRKGIESNKKFYQEVESVLMSDGEVGKFVGGLFGAMGKAMEKVTEIGEKVQGDYLEKNIQEIYGPQTD